MRSEHPNDNVYDAEKMRERRDSVPSSSSDSDSSNFDGLSSMEKDNNDAQLPTTVPEQTSETADLGLQLTCSYRAGADPQQLEAEHPPDGGWRAWMQVLGAHITVFCTWGFINGFGVFQSYYVEALNATPSAVSWIGSIQTFLLFSIGTFTGRALDAGYYYHVYRTGSVLTIIGIFATSAAKSYWQVVLSQGICCGLGAGFMFCPTIALTSTYFSSRRSLAMGLAATGSATGGIVIAVIVQQLLPKVGFGWTARVIGFVLIVLLGFSNVVLRPRVRARKTGGIIDLEAWKEVTYVCFTIGMFLTFLGLYFAFFYLSSFAKTHLGLPQSTSFTLLIVLNSVGIPGRILPNYVADLIGPLNLLIPMVLIGGILMLVWISIESHTSLLIWAAFYGLFAAAVQSLFPATMASLTKDLSKAGTRMGMVFSVISIACLTGTPVGGAFIQGMEGDYWGAQSFAGGCMIAGGVVLYVSRIYKVGWGLGKA